jgi:ABC-2 type transport system ATP-binding protein
MSLALEMRGVSKRYGRIAAVTNLDLEIRPGEVVGLIGPNGAGKSTTLRIALDLSTDFEGTVRLFGDSYRTHALDIKRRLGYVPEVVDPTGTLRIEEYVRYAGVLHNLAAGEINAAWSEFSGRLAFDADPRTRIDTLSKGNRQKLAIATSLLHRPALWVLDEPLSGLDPTGMNLLEQLVAERAAGGCAVWISTHTLDLVERVCDRLCVMVNGSVVSESSQFDRAGSAMELYQAAIAGAGR